MSTELYTVIYYRLAQHDILVMAQIQFSLIRNKVKIGRPEHLLTPHPLSPIEKDTLAQELSCEFCKISKKTFFTEEHLWWLLLKGISLGFSEISKCKLSSSLAHFGPASHFYTP